MLVMLMSPDQFVATTNLIPKDIPFLSFSHWIRNLSLLLIPTMSTGVKERLGAFASTSAFFPLC